MPELDIFRSKEYAYCACCRKQGKDYKTLKVGLFLMPFCDECFEKFQATVNQPVTKEVTGV